MSPNRVFFFFLKKCFSGQELWKWYNFLFQTISYPVIVVLYLFSLPWISVSHSPTPPKKLIIYFIVETNSFQATILKGGPCSFRRYDKYYQTPRVWLTGYDEVCFILLILVTVIQSLLTSLYRAMAELLELELALLI